MAEMMFWGFVIGAVSFTLGMIYERRKWIRFWKKSGFAVIDQWGEKF